MSGAVAAQRAPIKRRAALLSIASNVVLILLKVVAGAVTGSVALLSEAMQSSVDLVASVVAYVSIRKADTPADDDHPYGHAKFEELAAGLEGVLILVGSAVIVFESTRRLITGPEVGELAVGIAALAVSVVVNLVVSARIARRARETESPALAGDAAHLRTDAITSVGVLVGLVLVETTGAAWLDPVVAILLAALVTRTGVRLLRRSGSALVDQALPEDELAAVRETVHGFGDRGVAGFHALRARRAGGRRLLDLHVQFRGGTTLEAAHDTAHALQAAIERRLGGDADVLIHLEPEDRVRPGTEVTPSSGGAVSAG